MYRKIEVNAEHNEIILENSHGDKVIIPANKRNWVKQKLSEGCHDCIDSLVETLPVASQYAQDGSVYPPNTKVKVNQDNQIKEYDINSKEYIDLYNSGRLMNYDKNTDTYIATPLKKVTITAEAPQWLKDKRNLEEQYTKDWYIDNNLPKFSRSIGISSDNMGGSQKGYDEYINNKLAESILKRNPKVGSSNNERLAWYNSLSEKERDIVNNSYSADKFSPAVRAHMESQSNEAKKYGILETFRDVDKLAQSVEGTPERFRIFPNAENNYENYVNPLMWIGDMAKGLGNVPKDIKEENYLKATISIASPLLGGALGGLGAKTTGQFIKNTFLPLGGAEENIIKGGKNLVGKLSKPLATAIEGKQQLTKNSINVLGKFTEGLISRSPEEMQHISKVLKPEEFNKFREIQSLSSLSLDSKVTREKLIDKYLKSSLDENELQQLTGKSRIELEQELQELAKNPVKKQGSDLDINQSDGYVSGSYQEQMRAHLEGTPEYERLNTIIRESRRNRNNIIIPQNYESISNLRMQDLFRRNASEKAFSAGQKLRNLFTKKQDLSDFVSVLPERHEVRSLIPSLFKNHGESNSEVMRKIHSAFNELKASGEGYYNAANSISDNSAPLYYKMASKLNGEKGVEFLMDGFTDLNSMGFLLNKNADKSKVVDFMNTHLKDLKFNGKKLPAAYLDKATGSIKVPNLLIKKSAMGIIPLSIFFQQSQQNNKEK